jgi:hypothetical protein
MSTPSAQELDLRIQFSLVSKIRHAANAYKAVPAASSPEVLEHYLSALENLADYVAAKWRGGRTLPDSVAARPPLRMKRKPAAKPESNARIIPFGLPASAAGAAPPFNAA